MTDHYAAANRLIDGLHNLEGHNADFDMALAQVHATLALAEQQRIANLIALPVTVLHEPGKQPRPLPTRDEIAEAIYLNRVHRGRSPDDWAHLDDLDRKVWRIYANAVLKLLKENQ